jgi:hypothetical protein
VEGQPCASPSQCCQPLFCSEISRTCLLPQSDRARKANFASIDPVDVLARVRALPISAWRYTADDPAIRHIGPMAQDFAAAFGVGDDDRHIHPIDGQGVALAAIQGLAALVWQLPGDNVRLSARIAELERQQTGM